jgi:hypothetical protein
MIFPERFVPPAPGLAKVVQGDTVGDGVNPCRQPGSGVEVAKCTKHAKKRFLGQVFDDRFVSCHAPDQRTDHPRISGHEASTGVLVASQASLHQTAFVNVQTGGSPSPYDTARHRDGFSHDFETGRARAASYVCRREDSTSKESSYG